MIEQCRGLIRKRTNGSELVNYNIPNFPSYVHRGWILPNVTWEKVTHYHEDIELLYVLSGKMAYNVHGEIIHLDTGEGILVNANQIHYTIATQETPATYLIAVIHPRILYSSDEIRTKYVEPITGNPDITSLVFRKGDNDTLELARIMHQLFEHKEDEFNLTRDFFDLWSLTMNKCSTVPKSNANITSDSQSEAFKLMITFIQNEYSRPISLEDIAQAGNVSKTFCNTLFHKFTKEPPLESLNRYRTGKVSELIFSTSLSMGDIAEKVGYSSASYMAEMFKKYYGESPTKYKKEKLELYRQINSSI